MNASLKRGMRISLNTVINPHIKNRTVMMANGPRYVGPFADDEEVEGVEDGVMVAIILNSWCRFIVLFQAALHDNTTSN